MFFKGLNAIVDNFVSSSHVLSLVCTRMHVEGDLEKLIFSPAQPGITRDIRGAWISDTVRSYDDSFREFFEVLTGWQMASKCYLVCYLEIASPTRKYPVELKREMTIVCGRCRPIDVTAEPSSHWL